MFRSVFRGRLPRNLVLLLLLPVLAGCVLLDKDYRYGYVSEQGADVHQTGTPVSLPPDAPSISQRYRPVRVTRGDEEIDRAHEGFDIIASVGYPVIAPAPGVVVASYREPMYGNRVVIDHGSDDDGRHLVTRFFHLDERLVETGDTVGRGQRIASLGRSGLLAPNPHLHFELRELRGSDPTGPSEPLNPHLFWWDGVGRVTCFDLDRDFGDVRHRFTYPVPCRDRRWR